MSEQDKAKQRLEIAHVLFIDIVDYSKRLTDEQSEALQELNQIVRNTEAARDAEAAGQLTILPTGDGMALVFTGSVEEPVECALEISLALRAQPSLPVRMGIHSGPVHHVKDANGRENIAGVGINIAQRVMDCGDAGHILVSKRVADDLAQQRRWQPYLHELGDLEVKHGVVVSLVNLYAETIGNPTPPAQFGKVRGRFARSGVGTSKGLSPLARSIFIVVGLLIVLAIVSVIFAPAIMRSLGQRQTTTPLPLPPQPPAVPSPPSFGDVIKNEVAKKINDAMQKALDEKKQRMIEPSSSGEPRQSVSPARTEAKATPEKSIAVLPFVNMSADKNDEYLSDGMTEELLNVLSKVKGLRVPGRSSSFAFKGKNEEDIFRKVGDQLHVGAVLEGSVRKAGDKLRITAQLIDVANGYHLWSETYDRDLKDILAVESEVAQRVVDVLKVQLGVEEARALGKKSTGNPEAHRLYLLGRYHLVKDTQADVAEAVRNYEQAVQLDPGFALAYSGLSDAFAFMAGNAMPSREGWAKEKVLAEKALQLDPELAEAHVSLGNARANSFDWAGGEKEFNRALELNPNLGSAYDALAWISTVFRRFDEAIAKNKKALELDPLNPLTNGNAGWYLYFALRYDEAISALRSSIELFPNDAFSHFVLGLCLVRKGNLPEAKAELQKATELDDLPWYIGAVGYAYAASGDRAKAAETLRRLDDLAKRRYVTPNAYFLVYLGLGEKEKALDWLEKCYQDQDGACWFLKVDPLSDGLRNEPRFRALLKKVGLDQ